MPKQKSNPALTLQLPYPDRALSPNASKRHWRYKQPAKEAARTEAFYKAVSFRDWFTTSEKLQMTLTISPPDKKRRDLDNVFASMKPSIDGMCQALEIDDSQIRSVKLDWGGVIEDGAIELELKVIGAKQLAAINKAAELNTALKNILEYLTTNEEDDYQSENEPANHIYKDIEVLEAYLKVNKEPQK